MVRSCLVRLQFLCYSANMLRPPTRCTLFCLINLIMVCTSRGSTSLNDITEHFLQLQEPSWLKQPSFARQTRMSRFDSSELFRFWLGVGHSFSNNVAGGLGSLGIRSCSGSSHHGHSNVCRVGSIFRPTKLNATAANGNYVRFEI